MTTILAIGTGAGLVSALLFAVVITGSPLAVLLSYIAPLPVLIAALGWNHRAGIVATAAGALATAFAFSLTAGVTFALGVGIPAWWLAYLALLGRPASAGEVEWYPLGRLLGWIAAVAALVTLAGALALGGSYDSYLSTMRQAVETILSGRPGAPASGTTELPGGMPMADLVRIIVALVPIMTAASLVPMLAANLWLAAKVVSVSGRLPRPWPSIPDLALPREALPALAVSIVAALVADGFPALFAQALAGALSTAFALQGLATVHALTRGKTSRGALLGAVYLLVVVFLVWVLPLLALGGIAEALFRLRERWGEGLPRSRDLTS
ncbi:DUF2232 domain-containing protein [Chelatococcus sp. SYSU_G07232]|uniref:DUF2232 domain-containing protein n=1 Tax=Chelatococcus albus TaxID=3047466 RepID=A0ABT7AC66_9HYPH|nr:DUF2232 domain-containing protein [Chelatococcus sp. SYSU_G07232]MDJ1156963.1 DUF2232 domain-containing protein [Chelatococcus sp. SYSU_G07232]